MAPRYSLEYILNNITENYDPIYIQKQSDKGYPDFMVAQAAAQSKSNKNIGIYLYYYLTTIPEPSPYKNIAYSELVKFYLTRNDKYDIVIAERYQDKIDRQSPLYQQTNILILNAKIKNLNIAIENNQQQTADEIATSIRDKKTLQSLTLQLTVANKAILSDRKRTTSNRKQKEAAAMKLLLSNIPAGSLYHQLLSSETQNLTYRLYTITRRLFDDKILTLTQANQIYNILADIDDLDTRMQSKLYSHLFYQHVSLYLSTKKESHLNKANHYGILSSMIGTEKNKTIGLINQELDKIIDDRKQKIRHSKPFLIDSLSTIHQTGIIGANIFGSIAAIPGTITNIITIFPAVFAIGDHEPVNNYAFSWVTRGIGGFIGYLVGVAITLPLTLIIYAGKQAKDYLTSNTSSDQTYQSVSAIKDIQPCENKKSTYQTILSKWRTGKTKEKTYGELDKFIPEATPLSLPVARKPTGGIFLSNERTPLLHRTSEEYTTPTPR